MTQAVHSTMPTTFISSLPTTTSSSGTRRVRFKFDEQDRHRHVLELDPNWQTRSSDDVRSAGKQSVHRVEVQIPVQQGTVCTNKKKIFFIGSSALQQLILGWMFILQQARPYRLKHDLWRRKRSISIAVRVILHVYKASRPSSMLNFTAIR